MRWVRSLGDFFYPSLCLGCKNASDTKGYLCLSCFRQLQLIDQTKRCHVCFYPLMNPERNSLSSYCFFCSKKETIFRKTALFEPYGLPLILSKSKKEMVWKLLASFLIIQWEALGEFVPDDVLAVKDQSLGNYRFPSTTSKNLARETKLIFRNAKKKSKTSFQREKKKNVLFIADSLEQDRSVLEMLKKRKELFYADIRIFSLFDREDHLLESSYKNN